MEKDYKKGALEKEILLRLALGGMVLVCFVMPGMAHVLRLFQPHTNKDRAKIRRSFRNLRDRKLVNLYQKGGHDVLEITKLGKRQLLRYKLDGMQIKKPPRWDKKWRIIMFDIPKRKEGARIAFKDILRKLELEQYQKSVYITPYPCEDEVDFVKESLGLGDSIRYITATQIADEEVFLKKFNLSKH